MRFLIVDDDRDYREMLRITLSPYAKVDVVEHGTDAFKAYCASLKEEDPYVLICLDIMMPRRDGFETINSIRLFESKLGYQGGQGVKIVVMTGLEDQTFVERAIKTGCEAYVFKSQGTGKLLKTLQDLGMIPKK